MPVLELPIPSLTQLLSRLVAVVLASGVLGFGVAWLAGRAGDPGPRYDGRRSLSPFPHFDLVAILHALFFRCAWIKPVDVDRSILKGGWLGRILVVLGSCALLALASAVALALRAAAARYIPGNAGITVGLLLATFSDLAVVTALINLLPAPPMVGALLLPLGQGAVKALKRPLAYWLACAVVIALSLLGVTGKLASAVVPAWRGLLGY